MRKKRTTRKTAVPRLWETTVKCVVSSASSAPYSFDPCATRTVSRRAEAVAASHERARPAVKIGNGDIGADAARVERAIACAAAKYAIAMNLRWKTADAKRAPTLRLRPSLVSAIKPTALSWRRRPEANPRSSTGSCPDAELCDPYVSLSTDSGIESSPGVESKVMLNECG